MVWKPTGKITQALMVLEKVTHPATHPAITDQVSFGGEEGDDYILVKAVRVADGTPVHEAKATLPELLCRIALQLIWSAM